MTSTIQALAKQHVNTNISSLDILDIEKLPEELKHRVIKTIQEAIDYGMDCFEEECMNGKIHKHNESMIKEGYESCKITAEKFLSE